MAPENSDGKTRMRLRSLMILVAIVALALGFLVQADRTTRKQNADGLRFWKWMANVYLSNLTVKPLGTASVRFNTNMFEITTNCTQPLQTPTKKFITIQANFRSGPFSSVRQVTFETSGRTVTWPFEDIEAGRKIDLKAEFPEAFR